MSIDLAMSEAKTRNLSGMPWRHMIATHLLAGLVSGHTAAGYGRSADRSLTKRAVELTDILIEELAK